MRTLLAAAGITLATIAVGLAAYASQSDPVHNPTTTTTRTVQEDGRYADHGDTSTPQAATTPSPSAPPTSQDDTGLPDRDNRAEPRDDHDSDSHTDDFDDVDDHEGDHPDDD